MGEGVGVEEELIGALGIQGLGGFDDDAVDELCMICEFVHMLTLVFMYYYASLSFYYPTILQLRTASSINVFVTGT